MVLSALFEGVSNDHHPFLKQVLGDFDMGNEDCAHQVLMKCALLENKAQKTIPFQYCWQPVNHRKSARKTAKEVL